jgi:hypothetical protein
MRIRAGILIAALLAATAMVLASGAGAVAGEPDRDGDGFGDLTEDGCPWNATVQAECPPVRVQVSAVIATRGAIVFKLGVSSEAKVQVLGDLGLSAGAARTVLPGRIASFRAPLTQSVLRRLGQIDPQQALRVRMRVRSTDLAGRENDRVLTVKLHGRER